MIFHQLADGADARSEVIDVIDSDVAAQLEEIANGS